MMVMIGIESNQLCYPEKGNKYMTIQDELLIIEQKLNETMAFNNIRRRLNGIYTNCVALETMVTEYQASGLFASIPTETKQAYNRLYQIVLQLKTTIENDPDFDILINY